MLENFEYSYRLLKVDFRTFETQFSKNGIVWIIERRWFCYLVLISMNLLNKSTTNWLHEVSSMVKSLEIIFNFEIKIWKPRALGIGTMSVSNWVYTIWSKENVFRGKWSFCKIFFCKFLSMKYGQTIFEYLTLPVRFFVRLQNIYLLSVYRVTIFKCIFAGKYLARLQWEMHINVDLFIGGLNILQVLVLEMNYQFQENWGRGS